MTNSDHEDRAEELAIKLISGDLTSDEILSSLSESDRQDPAFKNLIDAMSCAEKI